MKASGKIGSNGVYVSDNVEKRFETDMDKLVWNMCEIILTVSPVSI